MGKYLELIRALLPSGTAWKSKDIPDKQMYKLLAGSAEEFERMDSAITDLVDQYFPDTTNLLLDEWEATVGDPLGSDLSTADRRAQIIQKLAFQNGQSKQFLIDLAASFGYTITITEYSDQVFRVDQNRVGDRLYSTDWAWTFLVESATSLEQPFRASVSKVGDRLLTYDEDTGVLTKLILKHKPAYTEAFFDLA